MILAAVALDPELCTTPMPRKPTKGYFVKGRFVAEGSELDLQLKAELRGTEGASKTELKRESTALQVLGEELAKLRPALLERLQLPASLELALEQAARITSHEGKRRQMQYVGKLMRRLDADAIAHIQTTLQEQHQGSVEEKIALHQAENWRDRLLADDQTLPDWLAQYPATDSQQLRALIRQARKDSLGQHEANVAQSQGLAPRKGRAYRDLFQLLREHMTQADSAAAPARCRQWSALGGSRRPLIQSGWC